MSSIASTTKVFPFFHNNGGWNSGAVRVWVKAIENRRDNRGNLVLFPTLEDDPREVKGFTYEVFLIMRRRFSDEIVSSLYHDLRATLTPGATAEEIDAGVSSHSAPTAQAGASVAAVPMATTPEHGSSDQLALVERTTSVMLRHVHPVALAAAPRH